MLRFMNRPGSMSGPDTSGMRSVSVMKLLFMRTSRERIRVRKRLRSMSAGSALCPVKSTWISSPCPAFILKKQLRPGHRRQLIRMVWLVRIGPMDGSLRTVKSSTVSAVEFPLANIMMQKMIITLPVSM